MEKLWSADYQARAAECLDAAQRTATPEVRQVYLDLMKHWIELADRKAKLDQGGRKA